MKPRRTPQVDFSPLLKATLPVITEPQIINSVFATGGAFEITATTVRMIFWEESMRLGDGAEFERRIVAKLAMSKSTARQYIELLSGALD